jgi:hypothetical protein
MSEGVQFHLKVNLCSLKVSNRTNANQPEADSSHGYQFNCPSGKFALFAATNFNDFRQNKG